MRHLSELKVRWLLIGYAAALTLLTATLILLQAPESILILAAIPVVLAATRYPRRVYLVMLNLLIFAALWAISTLSIDRTESFKTLIAAIVTVICLTELIRWQTIRRLALQKEVRWQARLLAETPNPVLRISSDFKVLSCNPATAPFLQSLSADDDQTVPAAWHTMVHEALTTGKQTDLEWEDRGRVYSCVFSPVADEDYVNTFLVDITPRHAAEAELRRQNVFLAALHETTLGMMNHLDLAELLEAIVGRATQLVNASFGWLYLVDPALDVAEVKVATDTLRSWVGTRLQRGEGLAGQVWLTGQPLVVEDYPAWSGRSAQYPQDLLQSAIGVPLKSDSQVIGVLGVSQNDAIRKFDDHASQLLGRFAQLASIALENARLYAGLERRAQELALLDRVRTALARDLDLAVVMRDVVETIALTFGYTQVSLYLLCDDVLHLHHEVGFRSIFTEIPLTSGVTGRAARTGQAILVPDVRAEPDFLGPIDDIASEICIPLFDQQRVFGILNMESTSGVRLGETDLRLLMALGEHINIAIERARLYREARQNENKYRSVVENVHEVIFQADATGAWTYLNPAWTQITGIEVADTLGKSVIDSIYPDDRSDKLHYLQSLLSGAQTSCQCEMRFLTADGGFRFLTAHAWPLRDSAGNINGVSGVLSDITERRLVEEELQHQRDFALYVMNTMGQGLTVTGADGKFAYVNPAFARMLGYPPETLIGREPEDFTFAEDLVKLAQAHTQRRAGATSSYETRLHGADGEAVYALITGTPHRRGGEIIGSVAVVTDLTERYRMEQALSQARDQALEASRLKSEFLATMSHEIRTPMYSVIGMNELLLQTTLSERQREYAEAVHLSAEGLLAILDDILDFSAIEADRLLLHETDFEPRAVLAEVSEIFAAKIDAKELSLHMAVAPDVPAWLCGDSRRLRQVLINLVGNAIKFTERGSVAIDANVGGTTEAGLILRFAITDTGVGIPQAAHQRLFLPFTQLDGSMARRYGGTGLGLAISKRLVELMGGEIGVESEAGSGACFWFTATFKHVADQPGDHPVTDRGWKAARTEPAAPVTGVRILLAEDNPVNQRLAILQIERLGYVVTAVADGRAAVDAVVENPDAFDLILMDCQMPVMDGFEAARVIRRAEPADRRVPIIAMTANAMRGDREACLAAGMDAYLSKPVRPTELDQTLRNWLVLPPAESPEPAVALALPQFAAIREKFGGDTLDEVQVTDLFETAGAAGATVINDLIDAFLTGAEARIIAMRAALAQGDCAALASAAHNLTGSSGSYGASRLSTLARQLETMARGANLAAAGELLAQLEAEFERVKCAFAMLRQPEDA
jgi:two-component system, sensor histidine kinase and response regulator